MRTEEYPADVVVVALLCDCGGVMEHDGQVLATAPPLYPHKCSKCGAKANVREIYPTHKFKIRGAKDESDSDEPEPSSD